MCECVIIVNCINNDMDCAMTVERAARTVVLATLRVTVMMGGQRGVDSVSKKTKNVCLRASCE